MATPGPCCETKGEGIEAAVLQRYAQGAAAVQPALCCPTDGYDAKYLRVIPQEIIDKDYGCGDPSRWAREGDVVVDLGSGAGKICYILSQKVGPSGRVIGVDFNDAMLDLARRHQQDIAGRIGHDNIRFAKARIQDLALDLELLDAWLAENPVQSLPDLADLEAGLARLRTQRPLIADASVDLVVSNCVLNLVRPEDKTRLFAEIFRVLRGGGRAVISDIVCDREPTPRIKDDPELWTGCIAGAFREDAFLQMFEEAGFGGVEILSRTAEPWQVVDGVEFRSMTVRAFKSEPSPALDRRHAVIYRGPWKQVRDDEGRSFVRGQRTAVSEGALKRLTDPHGPYAAQVIAVEAAGNGTACCSGESCC